MPNSNAVDLSFKFDKFLEEKLESLTKPMLDSDLNKEKSKRVHSFTEDIYKEYLKVTSTLEYPEFKEFNALAQKSMQKSVDDLIAFLK